ncbi:MAG: GAF domain-containing protein [Bacteroidota bacterium]
MKNTFGKNIIPTDEDKRLEEVYKYAELNGSPDAYFNEMAFIIAKCFSAPIALISLVGNEHVEFKGNFGLPQNTVDRGASLCSLAILDSEPTIFTDATKEPCLLTNPLVAGEFGLKFYAGAPITTKNGHHIGTVCVVDKHPRELKVEDIDLLKSFAGSVIRELEYRLILADATCE